MSHSPTARRFVAIPVVVTVIGLLTVATIAYFLRIGVLPLWKISKYELVNFTLTMQLMELPVSLLAIVLAYVYNPGGFKKFFRFKISFSKDSDWTGYGVLIAMGFTVGTALMMAVSVASQNGAINEMFFGLIPLVFFVAATNAWSEEIIARLVIVSGLDGKLSPTTICWISGGLFGLAHFYGTPSGFFGVIASGMLGWFLAKSVVETKSMGWALLIHFLQDVVIFGAGAMVLAGKNG